MSANQPCIFEGLQRRIGKYHLDQRLSIQADHSVKYFGKGSGKFHWENMVPELESISRSLKVGPTASGLERKGMRENEKCAFSL